MISIIIYIIFIEDDNEVLIQDSKILIIWYIVLENH